MSLDFSLVIPYLPFLFKAALITLEISVISIIFGLILGLATALMKVSKNIILKPIADFYIWVIRGTPLLVQLFIVYFGLPQFGVELSSFASAVIALGIHSGAYIAEIFRSGIQSVPKGQVEASDSLGMSYFITMKRIILPQALKVSIPPLGNQTIQMLKDSSLASLVTVSELLMISQRFAATNYAFMEFYITAAVFYLALTTIFSIILNKIENRLALND